MLPEICHVVYLREVAISKQLRQAIRESGQSIRKISQETGVSRATVREFLNGKTIRFEPTGDRLAEYFGLELGPPRKQRRR